MKRLLSVVLMAVAVLAPRARADSILSINITYVTATTGPSDTYFTLIGPDTIIKGYGGSACVPCSGPIFDLNSVGVSQVSISFFTTAIVGGTTYDPYNDLSLCCFTDLAGRSAGSSARERRSSC